MGCGGKTWMHGEMWVVTDAMDAAEQKLDRAERLKMGLSTAECLRRLEHDGYNPREETP